MINVINYERNHYERDEGLICIEIDGEETVLVAEIRSGKVVLKTVDDYMRQKYPLRSSLVWFDNAGYSNYGWMNHPTRNSGSFNAGYQRFCFWKIDDSRLPSKLRCVTDEVRDFFNDNVPF